MSTWARSRFVVTWSDGRAAKRRRTESLFGDYSDGASGEGDDGEKSDEDMLSDVSADSGDGSTGTDGVLAAAPAPPGPLGDASGRPLTNPAWVRPYRQGMETDTWLSVLDAIVPTKLILVSPLQWHPGLIMAALRYNDARYGLTKCPLVVFHPYHPNAPPVLETGGPKRKLDLVAAAHLADHTLERVQAEYVALHLSKVRQEASRAQLGTSGLAEASAPAVLPSMGSSSGTQASSQGAPEPAAPAGNLVNAFITVPGNFGKSGVHYPVPATSTEDSDTEACGGNSADLSARVLHLRNASAMRKYKLKVTASQHVKAGNGLHATADLEMGEQWPVKGPWFETVAGVSAWLADVLRLDFRF